MVLYLVPSNKAEEYIPPPFKVVNILPGYTTGGFYISCSLENNEDVNEFALLPAYTQYEGKRGFYYSPLNISKNSGHHRLMTVVYFSSKKWVILTALRHP